MLENAGAIVYSARERDKQPHDIIIDNDNNNQDCGLYIEEGHRKTQWGDGALGFAIPQDVLRMGENPFTLGTSRIMHSATHEKDSKGAILWIPDIPEDGYYAVYVSYQSYPSSIPDAEYLIMHTGVTTRMKVNQQMGGSTWVYLGSYKFRAGQHDDQMVMLTNHSDHTGIISADAVRFGGGSSIISRGPNDTIHTSRLPRYYEGSRYQGQWSGFPTERYANYQGEKDYAEDINSRSLMTNYLLGGSSYCPDSVGMRVPVELILGLHTDAGFRDDDTTIGCLGIYTTDYNNKRLGNAALSRYTSRDLTDIVQTHITEDINRSLSPTLSFGYFTRRSMWDRNYSESRLPDVPSTIIELLSHQNFADMKYGLDPAFRFTVGRAVYKGMLKYLSNRNGIPYTVQPLPVEDISATSAMPSRSGTSKAVIRWREKKDPLEPTADPTGYIIYTRVDNGAFDNGKVITDPHRKDGMLSAEVEIMPGHVYSFRIRAFNDGGKSFPSETVCTGVATDGKSESNVLIVNNFDRVSGPAFFDTPNYAGFDNRLDSGVPYIKDIAFIGEMYQSRRRLDWLSDDNPGFGASFDDKAGIPVAGNTFDYAVLHGNAILKAG